MSIVLIDFSPSIPECLVYWHKASINIVPFREFENLRRCQGFLYIPSALPTVKAVNVSHTLSTRRLFGGALLLLTLVSIIVPPAMAEIAQAETDLTGVSIAIYAGGASEGHNESRKALIEMFEWMNASSIQEVVGEDIRNGALDDVDIFALPGSSPYTLLPDLQTEGVEIFEDFIRNGGSFFGIVSGSYYEWDDYFHFNDFFLNL